LQNPPICPSPAQKCIPKEKRKRKPKELLKPCIVKRRKNKNAEPKSFADFSFSAIPSHSQKDKIQKNPCQKSWPSLANKAKTIGEE
jgi:hypothetical protein